MNARQLIEGAAKQWIKSLPKPLRSGSGWILSLRGDGISDDIWVEMLRQNEYDLLDAPYSLGYAVDEKLIGTPRDTFYAEVDVYLIAIAREVKKGVLSGVVSGIVGECAWEREDRASKGSPEGGDFD